MCFVLYAGSDRRIPTIAWDESTRALHCEELSEHELAVREKFRSVNVMYVGSDLRCGCGFRSAMYQRGGWPEEEAIGTDWYEPPSNDCDYDSNHGQLRDFVDTLLNNTLQVELYGCQSGQEQKPHRCDVSITLADLVRPTFLFRERGRYTITRSCED